jgi:ECF sigma factor
MDEASSQPVTELLQAWSAGDEKALKRLVPLIYGELRQLAQRRMLAENPGVSLPLW